MESNHRGSLTGATSSVPTLASAASLRILGAGLGFLATLIFFAAANSALDRSAFAALIVALNCGVVIQAFDLGVGARFVTSLAQHRGVSNLPFAATEYVALNALVATGTSVASFSVFVVTLHNAGDEQLWPVGLIAIAGACGAASGASFLGSLIATERPVTYYLVSLAQPICLLVGSTYLWVAKTGNATWFASASALSALAPTLLGIAIAARTRGLILRTTVARRHALHLWRSSLPIGASQVAGTILYLGLPTLIGLSGSIVAVAEYGFTLRIYLALWSLVGIAHVAYWPTLARAYDRDRSEANGLLRRVDRQGALIGLCALAVFIALYLLLPLVNHSGLMPSLSITIVIGIAFVVRSCFIGEVLGLSIVGPSYKLLGAQWLLGGITAGVVVLYADVQFLLPALALLGATTLDGLFMRWWTRHRTDMETSQRRSSDSTN